MAGVASEEAGVESFTEGFSSVQRCQSGELTEWRSSEQVENGTPSTSPLYWDTDDYDDGGPKPSRLFGKYTWKIEKFSQISKRELRSSSFEVGGYSWYILIYPQGCDVCNHLSLFLCVANHDKLLPGWNHFAQFTIAVVNKDPKKSKYSDTLHRFWKKEHDWGWKKFMELSKVSDGFLDDDTLIIKAQVQVIRKKEDRPFRCLDCQYRRELVRVYLTNVEQICRRIVEERRIKLVKLLEDKNRWKSFNDFWKGMDQNSRRRMSREKTDVILKEVVKQFFVEKEVTSTLVMDSLYSGLNALEGQNISIKERMKLSDTEQIPDPIVCVEKDAFILVDDVLKLLERATLELLPPNPKDEKGPQNRTKDGNSGEDFNKDSIERDERRLTELGRRTLEIFVLAHIFNQKIEISYQEAVALKRQEELIREEEALWQAESEQKARRGNDKEKKSKKKQAKQKRNNRKGKEKGKHQEEVPSSDKKDSTIAETDPAVRKAGISEDASDVSDSLDGVTDIHQPDSEDRDASPVNWDTDTSEAHPLTEASSSGISGFSSIPNGVSEKRSTSAMDDSSSTCSTDSVPSVVTNGSYKANSHSNYQYVKSPSRGKHSRGKASDASWTAETDSQFSGSAADVGDLNDVSGGIKAIDCDTEAVVGAAQDRITSSEQPVVKKVVEEIPPQNKPSTRVLVDVESSSKERTAPPTSSGSPPTSPPKNLHSAAQSKPENKTSTVIDPAQTRKASSNGTQRTDKPGPSMLSSPPQSTVTPKPENHQNVTTLKLSERPAVQQLPVISMPSSAPLVPGPRPMAPVVSMVQTPTPSLNRSVSATGRLGPDPSPANQSYAPLSYRNAIVGNPVGSVSAAFVHASSVNHPSVHTQPPMFLTPSSDRVDSNPVQSGFAFGMINRDISQNGPRQVESMQGVVADEFPHIDIINDLLDEEHGNNGMAPAIYQSHSNGHQHFLNRQCSFPGDMGISADLGPGSSSCRFERTRSYHDSGFQRSYSSFRTHFDTLREYIPQASPLPYANGHINGLMSNQWEMAATDLSLVGMRNAETDGSAYYSPDYSNLGNGYAVFRPSSEH